MKGDGSPHPFIEQIESLKNGEAVFLQNIALQNPELIKNNPELSGMSDYWDDDIGGFEGILWREDPDQSGSIGSVKLRSAGIFTAVRKGDTVEIRGRVDHQIDNVYDFNNESIADKVLFSDFRKMQDQGFGTPFRVQGEASQWFVGTLEIRDGTITNPQFIWTDK